MLEIERERELERERERVRKRERESEKEREREEMGSAQQKLNAVPKNVRVCPPCVARGRGR